MIKASVVRSRQSSALLLLLGWHGPSSSARARERRGGGGGGAGGNYSDTGERKINEEGGRWSPIKCKLRRPYQTAAGSTSAEPRREIFSVMQALPSYVGRYLQYYLLSSLRRPAGRGVAPPAGGAGRSFGSRKYCRPRRRLPVPLLLLSGTPSRHSLAG